MIRFSALLPISAPCECVFVNECPYSNKRTHSDKDRFDRITESDVKDVAPDSLIIDASDTEVIDVEKINL